MSIDDAEPGRRVHVEGEGQGRRYVMWCPGCRGLHQITTLWDWNGDVLAPTFAPSIHVRGGSRDLVCHSFVRDGRWEFLADSTHALAGQTVPMQPIAQWGSSLDEEVHS